MEILSSRIRYIWFAIISKQRQTTATEHMTMITASARICLKMVLYQSAVTRCDWLKAPKFFENPELWQLKFAISIDSLWKNSEKKKDLIKSELKKSRFLSRKQARRKLYCQRGIFR